MLRLGFIIRFLGHPVITGFTSGAAIVIASGQLKYMLGISYKSQHALQVRYDGCVVMLLCCHVKVFACSDLHKFCSQMIAAKQLKCWVWLTEPITSCRCLRVALLKLMSFLSYQVGKCECCDAVTALSLLDVSCWPPAAVVTVNSSNVVTYFAPAGRGTQYYSAAVSRALCVAGVCHGLRHAAAAGRPESSQQEVSEAVQGQGRMSNRSGWIVRSAALLVYALFVGHCGRQVDPSSCTPYDAACFHQPALYS